MQHCLTAFDSGGTLYATNVTVELFQFEAIMTCVCEAPLRHTIQFASACMQASMRCTLQTSCTYTCWHPAKLSICCWLALIVQRWCAR
jgi:hypothetical protein